MANKTNVGLVEFVKQCVGRPYIYGTFGEILTESLLAYKAKQYPNQLGPERVKKAKADFIGKRTYDCIGLIKAYLWSASPDSNPVYNAKQDLSADGTYNKATEKGPISTIPEIPGICVRYKGHVGVYIGGGYVIEARGFNYGVVKTALKARKWTDWYKNPFINYNASTVENNANKSVDEIAREVIAEKWGDGEERKKRLTAAGYDYAAVQKRVNEILGVGTKKYMIVTGVKHALNMRSAPNMSGGVINTIPLGAKVELIEKTTAKWYKVKYDGKTGYCWSEYLKA